MNLYLKFSCSLILVFFILTDIYADIIPSKIREENINNQISLLLPLFERKVDLVARHVNSLNKINIEIKKATKQIRLDIGTPKKYATDPKSISGIRCP